METITMIALLDGLLALIYFILLIVAAFKDDTLRYIHLMKAMVLFYIFFLAVHVAFGLSTPAYITKPFRVMVGVWMFLESLTLYVSLRTRN